MFSAQNDIIEAFRQFPRLANEIDPRDVVFRIDFDDEKRAQLPPFSSGKSPYAERYLETWHKLYKGEISEETALEQITCLMEEYYGMEYSLGRGFNH